ncbi:MAG: hypothetical protein IJX65_03700 [Alistipes sp.]|nr:hypothetical protein [Alistipes sp.]
MKIPTVSIHKRKLKDRRGSIYLSYRPAITDPITKKDHAFETLGVYLWEKPRNDIEKEFNKQAMLRVEGIMYRSCLMHFTNFTKGRCCFQEDPVDLCTRFQKYLLSY